MSTGSTYARKNCPYNENYVILVAYKHFYAVHFNDELGPCHILDKKTFRGGSTLMVLLR